ncbi:MAG: NYN domain-containing protein [Actinobacteria bacterium]|nr:NYN domain-containing protein [Actinomycetota bacterium]
MAETERTLAVFIDFENLAIGFKHRRGEFDISTILERLVEKGKVIVKKAYADWGEYKQYTRSLHENAIELIEIPKRQMTGKNSADIRLAVDAMDLAWSKEHIDTFVIVSGDSDFSPLVSKLKENGKHVIGLGMKESTSELLAANCDEFIYYEDLERQAAAPTAPGPQTSDIPQEKKEVFDLLLESIAALIRENKDPIFASMVKDTMQRKRPSFSESTYGYRSFSSLLQEAEKRGVIKLHRDKKAGWTYVVEGFVE